MDTIKKQLEYVDTSGNVFITGNPASGKTFISKVFEDTHIVIHADDYMKYGYRESIYKIIEDIPNFQQPFVIEGVMCYRLLRKLAQRSGFKPDLIIGVWRDSDKIKYIYEKERPDKDFKKVEAMIKANTTVFYEYLQLDNSVPFYILKND